MKISINDPVKVLNGVKLQVSDPKILQEIKERYDFSSDETLRKSFQNNLGNSWMEKIIKATAIINPVEHQSDEMLTEAIVKLHDRPTLLVQNDSYEIPPSDIWKQRLAPFQDNITRAIKAVGRIESPYDWSRPYYGTGFLVEGTDIIVTNSHVAEFFIDKIKWPQHPVYIDFKEEHLNPEESAHQILEVLFYEPCHHPDVALLRVKTIGEQGQALPQGLRLSQEAARRNQNVLCIGYPAWDGERNKQSIMQQLFQNIYEVKRISPGQVLRNMPTFFSHDCATLGGSSGSPIVDLVSGDVVGLHYYGDFLKENRAIHASIVAQIVG